MSNLESIRYQIETARGKRPADLLLRGGKIVNVFSGEIYNANIAISNSIICGVGTEYREGSEIYDLNGMFIIPGLIDAHIHLESSMLLPHEFARAVLPHGTTSIISDPHEIVNVLGVKGIKYILESSRGIPFNLFISVSSCVPASNLETSGAIITSADMDEFYQMDRVVGLGEMMNVPGILQGSGKELNKILTARQAGWPIDGHCPSLSGRDLNAYVASGIGSDHESITVTEAMEKLRLGMHIMIREGSAARNLEELLPMISEKTQHQCMFVSDDKHPRDLLRDGHMDHILRKAVKSGLDPIVAIRMATINPANAFSRKRLGAIAPGFIADIAAVKDLEQFEVNSVWKDGRLVVSNKELLVDLPRVSHERALNTMKVNNLTLDRFKIKIQGKQIRVIELISGQIRTRQVIEEVSKNNGEVQADPSRDLLKIAVIERHHGTGNIGVGFVKGFGLKKGALASSVAHDSHNIIVVGTNDNDMYIAVQQIIEMGGGHVVVSEGRVLGRLALPIAGLLSDKSLDQIVFEEDQLFEKAKRLGVKPVSPFIKLSFLSLSVIPEIKITDKGLIDVNKYEIVGLEP